MADKSLFNIDYEWDGQEAEEIFAKPIFTDPELLKQFRIIPNVKSKKKLAVDSILQKVLKKKAGCARNPSGEVINISQVDIEVERVGLDLEQCATTLEDSLLEEELNTGNDIYNLDGTQIKSYIEKKVKEALMLDIPRVGYFADTASADPNYNQFDGVFKVLHAYAATNPKMKIADIPAELPNEDTEDGAKAVVKLFKDLYKAQFPVMKALPKQRKKYLVNDEIRDALIDAYTTLGGKASGDIYLKRTQDGEGVETVYFKGIEVIGMAHWTDIIETDFDGSQKWRMILTDTQNICLGTDRVDDAMTVEIMYHPYQKVNTIDAEFKLGVQILWPELTVFRTSPVVAG